MVDLSIWLGKNARCSWSIFVPWSCSQECSFAACPAVLQHVWLVSPVMHSLVISRFETTSSACMEEQGFEKSTVADILKAKDKNADGSLAWCTTDDTVYDSVKSMTEHNVGALVVVKPGEQKSVAGIMTERDYLRKIIVQSTKVGDVMTEENKLITVTPDTKVLRYAVDDREAHQTYPSN